MYNNSMLHLIRHKTSLKKFLKVDFDIQRTNCGDGCSAETFLNVKVPIGFCSKTTVALIDEQMTSLRRTEIYEIVSALAIFWGLCYRGII